MTGRAEAVGARSALVIERSSLIAGRLFANRRWAGPLDPRGRVSWGWRALCAGWLSACGESGRNRCGVADAAGAMACAR